MVAFTALFRSPFSVPNGLQLVHHEDAAGSSDADGSLWIADQITDRVALVDTHQVRGEDDHYCVAKHIREIPSESSNTSGMTYGGGSLWLAANGAATAWRSEKETDAGPGDGIVLEVDPATGETRSRHPVPGGGCHGIEYHPPAPPHPTLISPHPFHL